MSIKQSSSMQIHLECHVTSDQCSSDLLVWQLSNIFSNLYYFFPGILYNDAARSISPMERQAIANKGISLLCTISKVSSSSIQKL